MSRLTLSNEFQLGGIVPWGRTAEEYELFFDLAALRAPARVLDCGGGPSSFAAEWSATGHFVVSCDPMYLQSCAEAAADFEQVAERMLEGMRKASARFNWDFYGSPERVVERRRMALSRFLSDRAASEDAARYVAARLPQLPFVPSSFDLVLSSHLLFLYSEELDLNAHVAALYEMLRVGREVRVFPLLNLRGEVSQHLPGVVSALEQNVRCELVPVPFEFQVGATSMLRLRRK